jgi:type II secretory pathway pseudopilin PulG
MERLIRRMRSARRAGGFTLLEVVVAMGMLATGLLAASAAQLYAMRGGKTGRHTSDAAEIAQTRIEQLQRMEFDDLLSTGGAWEPAAGDPADIQIQTAGAPLVEQAYTVQTRITNTVAPSGGVFLKTIDVRVRWDEPNRPGRSYTITTMRHNDARS